MDHLQEGNGLCHARRVCDRMGSQRCLLLRILRHPPIPAVHPPTPAALVSYLPRLRSLSRLRCLPPCERLSLCLNMTSNYCEIAALAHAFEWDSHIGDCLTVQEADAILTRMDGSTCSHAFAGNDAPLAALHGIVHQARRRSSRKPHQPFMPPRCLHVTEWCTWQQAEFKQRESLIPDAGPSPCIFGDIACFLVDSVKVLVKDLLQHPEKIMPSLLPHVLGGRMIDLSAGFCKLHGRKCNCAEADSHITVICGR